MEQDRALGFSDPEYCPIHRLIQVRSYSRIACHHIELEMTRDGEELVQKVEKNKGIGSLQGEELIKAEFDPWAKAGEGYGPGAVGRFKRPVRVFLENQAFQPIKTKEDFKISEKADELLEAIETHQVTVLVGKTGSGKSTYIPWLLLTGGEPGKLSKWARRGPICVTQPRIQATRQVPGFIANQLNGTTLGVGAQIGFSHSGADEYDRRTRLIFKTDGKLINDIVSGAVANYSIIMIDEAHERSVNIDLILGLLKDQLYLYPHLRLIIASATIDHKTFIDYYGSRQKVPLIFSEGIQHEVKHHYWSDPDDDWWDSENLWWASINGGQLPSRQQLPRVIGELVEKICRWLDNLDGKSKDAEDGHILVFLPGSREIDQTVSIINSLNLHNVVALPLYSQRPQEEQDEALNPQPKKHPKTYGKRRVVVSTNVAETSLTVEGIKHVIDTGYIKEGYWSPVKQVQELQTVRHSKAGCKQRWGRAGRISPGHAYMLYTREDFDGFPDDSTPEIARSSLEQVLLTAKAAGVRTAGNGQLDFHWMPLKYEDDQVRFGKELHRAYQSLLRQNAINSDGDLTSFGLEMRGLPAELQVARICVEAELHGMGVEAATLLPFLKLALGLPSLLIWDREWDAYQKYQIRQQQLDLVFGCHDDLDLFIKLWLLWENRTEKQRKEWEIEAGVNVQSFTKSIVEERQKLLQSIKDWRKAEDRPPSISRLDSLRALIAHCLPGEIYVPVEQKSEEKNVGRSGRFDSLDLLEWQASWEDGGLYQEYDDELNFDESYTSDVGEQSGIYTRFESTPGGETEADLIEIVPTSVCYGREDATTIVVCQRRANFNHPVRAKVVGMNIVRIDPSWLPSIQGTLVDRCLLYADLSRRRPSAGHEAVTVRLFLPTLFPRGTKAPAIIRGSDKSGCISLELSLQATESFRPLDLSTNTPGVRGRICKEQAELFSSLNRKSGEQIDVEVLDYEIDPSGDPLLVLGIPDKTEDAFKQFRRAIRSGDFVDVETIRIMEDPLGRNPLFLVREINTGLTIPMSDADFCGNSSPRAFFGRRFAVGDRFKVQVEAIDVGSEQVQVSRGRQLLKEYLNVLRGNSQIVNVEVKRVDALGVYVGPPSDTTQDTYIGFVRHALWPLELSRDIGRTHVARARPFEKQFTLQEISDLAKEKNPLPVELDLGIDFDLLLPLAFDRFAANSKEGDLIHGVIVEKALDGGGLLVSLTTELKGVIFAPELGLDSQGRLRKASSYPPGSEVKARIIAMNPSKKTVRCSLMRILPPPDDLTPDSIIKVTVEFVRTAYNDPHTLELTCALDGKFAVGIKTPNTKKVRFRPGDQIEAVVLQIDRTFLIEAAFVSFIEKDQTN